MPDPRQPFGADGLHAGESVLLEPASRLCRHIALLAERRPFTQETAAEMGRALRLLRRLLDFALPPGPEVAREELEAGAKTLAKFTSPGEAEKALFAAGDYRVGRAAKRRYAGAAALEWKRNNPHVTRKELARKFCPCGKATHGEDCVERLRRDMQRLNALIKQIFHEFPA